MIVTVAEKINRIALCRKERLLRHLLNGGLGGNIMINWVIIGDLSKYYRDNTLESKWERGQKNVNDAVSQMIRHLEKHLNNR